MRNAIAHGDIVYSHGAIEYIDSKKGRVAYDLDWVIRIFDDLLDACNGLALAFRVFFLRHPEQGLNIPEQVLFDELAAETENPWWHVEFVLRSRFDEGSQLLLCATANTYDERKVVFSALQTGVASEYFFPGYDRYFMSMRTPKALIGMANMTGGILKEIRERGATDFTEFGRALKEFAYLPRHKFPSLVHWFEMLLSAFKSSWQSALRDLHARLNLPSMLVRRANLHRIGRYAVLEASVVVAPYGHVDQGMIRYWRRIIFRAALTAARRKLPLRSLARYLPLGLARVSVFGRDFRERRLSGYGLGSDLIAVISLYRCRTFKIIDIADATVEVEGALRTAWNKAWLEEQTTPGNSGRETRSGWQQSTASD